MSEGGHRSGAARDVPPPRPVRPQPPGGAGESLGSVAARAVADAVAGLLRPAPGGPRRPTAAVLGDVLGGVSTALGAAWGNRRDGEATPGGPERQGSGPAVLDDLLTTVAPWLPIRDAAALRAAHPGAPDDEIADALVARASRLTANVGTATGGLAGAHWLAPASLLALPLELGAETLLVAGIEVVLLGELHELYGRPAPGDARARADAYLAAWSEQRSVDGIGATGLSSLLGSAGARALRRRMTRRLATAVPSAAPLLVSAALGGRGNRRATEKLADRVLADLRGPLRTPSERG